MSKSTRKIVAALLSVAMVLTLVVGLSASASAQTVTFTRDLTVGSTGADVTALQTWLATKGYFSVTPTGYFGSITKRAVAQYQAANGITPAVGYFGPKTRASVNGTATGSVGTTVPGCPAGAVYNYLTGALCSTTGGSTTTGSNVEGSLTVSQSATPANNTNIQTNSDVPVYGLQLKAQLGDVTVNRLDLNVGVTSTSGNENPGNFVNAIKVWDGSTLVKSWSVGTADFIQGTTSSSYYVRLSNIGFVVAKDATKNLVVSFSTNGGIDNSRTVTIYGYGTNSLLATSGNNVNSYYDVSGLTRTHIFQKPGTATLTVAASASPVDSMTTRVSSTDGAKNVTLETFTVKSETGDSKVTTVAGTIQASVNQASAIYLWDGSTLLGSQSVASTTQLSSGVPVTVTFSNLSVAVAKDQTKTLTLTADFPANTINGNIASTTVTTVTYQKPNGTSADVSTTVTGAKQYFYNYSPTWTLLSATLTSAGTSNTGSTTGLTATFQLKAKPVGGTMVTASSSDFKASVASSTGSGVDLGTADSVVVSGSPSAMAENAEYTVTVVFNVSQSDLTGLANGTLTSETVTLTQANAYFNGGAVLIPQTWGLSTFKTNPATFVK